MMTLNPLKKASVLLFALMLSPLTEASPQTANFQDSYQVDGTTYTLKLKKTFVTIGYGYGEKLDFSVLANGKFLFADEKEGGTTIGCRFPFTAPQDYNPIQKLVLNNKPAGWQLNTLDACGSVSVNKQVIILPPSSKSGDSTYVTRTFVSSFPGIYVRPADNNDGIEVWYTKFVECGCTATDVLIPLMQVIGGHHKIPANIDKWPTETWKHPDFQTVFLAAMADKNLALLQASKKLLANSVAAKGSCIAQGVPTTPQKLDEIIQSIKSLDENQVSQYYGN